jgi:hypothetical protein
MPILLCYRMQLQFLQFYISRSPLLHFYNFMNTWRKIQSAIGRITSPESIYRQTKPGPHPRVRKHISQYLEQLGSKAQRSPILLGRILRYSRQAAAQRPDRRWISGAPIASIATSHRNGIPNSRKTLGRISSKTSISISISEVSIVITLVLYQKINYDIYQITAECHCLMQESTNIYHADDASTT